MKPLLLVEDTPSLQMVYESVLRGSGYDVVSAGTAAEGLAKFRALEPDVVLLDLVLPDRPGLDVLREMRNERPNTNVIVVTANGSINRAVEAMRTGAYEFLLKPFNEQRFLHAIENALVDVSNTQTPAPAPESTLPPFVGASEPMVRVYDRIRSVSRSMATVFVTGESGTGKEICAQAVHDNSSRAAGPFVPLNCGAIPSDLLESEVFGHLKGSFTGAIADKVGAAAAADGGTLFLDEVCELDLNLQTKFLRFLQTSMIQPVGAPTPRKVSVRIICATNRDPMEEVRRGRFREDLYYRLRVIPIHLPPLRDRGEDVVEIAEHALRQFSREEGKSFTGLSGDVAALFQSLPWPGNVRQLLNVLRHAVVLHDGPEVTAEMLPGDLPLGLSVPAANAEPHAPQRTNAALDPLIGRPLAEIERMVIEETIARNGGSVTRAARVLDVSPSTIYRKRDAWGNRG